MAQALDLWVESVERYNARKQDARRWEWVRYFDQMARLHSNLAADYEARAEALMHPPARESGESSLPESEGPGAACNTNMELRTGTNGRPNPVDKPGKMQPINREERA
jgi:hypothetical protein